MYPNTPMYFAIVDMYTAIPHNPLGIDTKCAYSGLVPFLAPQLLMTTQLLALDL